MTNDKDAEHIEWDGLSGTLRQSVKRAVAQQEQKDATDQNQIVACLNLIEENLNRIAQGVESLAGSKSGSLDDSAYERGRADERAAIVAWLASLPQDTYANSRYYGSLLAAKKDTATPPKDDK